MRRLILAATTAGLENYMAKRPRPPPAICPALKIRPRPLTSPRLPLFPLPGRKGRGGRSRAIGARITDRASLRARTAGGIEIAHGEPAVGLDPTPDLSSAPQGAAAGNVGRRRSAAKARALVNPGPGGDQHAHLRRPDVAPTGLGGMWGVLVCPRFHRGLHDHARCAGAKTCTIRYPSAYGGVGVRGCFHAFWAAGDGHESCRNPQKGLDNRCLS